MKYKMAAVRSWVLLLLGGCGGFVNDVIDNSKARIDDKNKPTGVTNDYRQLGP